MGKSSRDKGSRAEREFINAILDELGGFFGAIDKNWNQREGQRYDLKLGPFAVEVKRVEKLSLGSWWLEAVKQAEMNKHLMPMLAYRQSRQPWKIVLTLRDVGYLMDATSLIKTRRRLRPGMDWQSGINFTISMPLQAFSYFCREYMPTDVARGETPP